MTKTVVISDNTHLLIVEKQIEMRRKYGVYKRISDMVEAYIKYGVDKSEEIFELKQDESSQPLNIVQDVEIKT